MSTCCEQLAPRVLSRKNRRYHKRQLNKFLRRQAKLLLDDAPIKVYYRGYVL